MKNTTNTVQELLVRAANKLQPATLEQIIFDAQMKLGIGINREWATEALESRSFIVEDIDGELLVRKALKGSGKPEA